MKQDSARCIPIRFFFAIYCGRDDTRVHPPAIAYVSPLFSSAPRKTMPALFPLPFVSSKRHFDDVTRARGSSLHNAADVFFLSAPKGGRPRRGIKNWGLQTRTKGPANRCSPPDRSGPLPAYTRSGRCRAANSLSLDTLSRVGFFGKPGKLRLSITLRP